MAMAARWHLPRSVIAGLAASGALLLDEGYTDGHRLERLKTPKVPETLVDVLTAAEISRVLESEPPNTPHGSRNHAMLVLALDTGLRMSEIATLERRNLDLDQGILRVFGKGSKERMVPFGYTATKSVQRYLLHFRPDAARARSVTPASSPRRTGQSPKRSHSDGPPTEDAREAVVERTSRGRPRYRRA